MINKIITHNGIFHADDALSVALIHELVDESIPLERTRDIKDEYYTDPGIWLIDVGSKFDRALNNLDHHQNRSLEASCMLVLTQLFNYNLVSIEQYDELFTAVAAVSDIDCNGPAEFDGFQFNTLIKSFNALDNGWDTAVHVCRQYVKACVSIANKAAESRAIWDKGEVLHNVIRVCDAFPVHWKRYHEQSILVYPNDGKWSVITINSDELPLISTGREDFMHANAFLAVFKYKQDAIVCAIKSCASIV